MHVRALNTWRHWADGHAVPDKNLRTALSILSHRAGAERDLAVALGRQLDNVESSRRVRAPLHYSGALPHGARHDVGIER